MMRLVPCLTSFDSTHVRYLLVVASAYQFLVRYLLVVASAYRFLVHRLMVVADVAKRLECISRVVRTLKHPSLVFLNLIGFSNSLYSLPSREAISTL